MDSLFNGAIVSTVTLNLAMFNSAI